MEKFLYAMNWATCGWCMNGSLYFIMVKHDPGWALFMAGLAILSAVAALYNGRDL